MGTDNHIKLLFLGDIIGKPGRRVVKEYLSQQAPEVDLIIANVENAAHGFGVSESNLQELTQAGVNVFTGGNHTFDRKEIFEFIDKTPHLLRPANYPEGTAGKGSYTAKVTAKTSKSRETKDIEVGIINVIGRVFMEPLASPFLVADKLIEEMRERTKVIFVDFHAEATAEKVAMGWHLDGKISAMVGTHTHVQTADERILPKGTGYLTDAGCCGPRDGVIGMDQQGVFRRMIEQLPSRFEVAEGPAQLCGVIFTIDTTSGKAVDVQRVRYAESLEKEAVAPPPVPAKA
ncbi:MAG TPA: TIGR00282 family metallophosphoesterase [Oculatellaceae cyanobacterium]